MKMKKYFLSGSLITLSLFLMGAGCSNVDKQINNAKVGSNTVSTGSKNKTISSVVVVVPNNTSTVKIFNLTAKNFAFSIKEIKAKKGDKVTINFTSTDGYHDWVVDEFKAATQKVQTGGNTSVTFTADKTGVYEYYCSVGGHRKMGMVGKLIVE